MTLTARILVGDKLATAAPFPEPGSIWRPGRWAWRRNTS